MSLLNGLSAAGGAIKDYAGAVGLEAQKNDLHKEVMMLADQLATTRETKLQGQRQTFEQEQQGRAQGFQGGENEKQRQNAILLENTRLGSQAALQKSQQEYGASQGALTRAAELERENLRLSQLPESLRVLRAFGVQLPGLAPQQSSSSTPASGGNSDVSSVEPAASASGRAPPGPSLGGIDDVSAPSSPSGSPAPTGMPQGSDITKRLIEKALSLPAEGSDAAIRSAVAEGVRKDPVFKYKPADQQAIEVEHRLAVAGGKIGSAEALHEIAKAISTYDLSPLDERARMVAGGPDVMADVLSLNPKYNASNYAAVMEAKKAITPGGTLFVPISAMETSLGHASHFLEVATQLGNYGGGNWANVFPNKIASNVGAAPLVNALQQTAFAMAEEGNRIYAGNAGTEGAINNWVKSFPVNGSLADQAAAVKNFAQLMGDKFDTMAYHLNKTFQDSGVPPVELLSPKGQATYQRLTTMGPDGKPKAPAEGERPPLSSFMSR